MGQAPVTVTIVLDPEFASPIEALAARGPVWMTGSASNEATVRAYWAAATPGGHDVTYWSAARDPEREQDWLDMLDTLELHHSADWAGPGIARVQVIGCPLNDAARAALNEFRYAVDTVSERGFTATKTSQPEQRTSAQ